MNIPDSIIITGIILLCTLTIVYILDLRFTVQQQKKEITSLRELSHEYLSKWAEAQVELRKKK